MTQQQVKTIWDVLGRIGGTATLIGISIIAYFEVDARRDVKATRDMVIELRLNQANLTKDVAYHAVYIDQYGERLTKLESKQ